MNRTWMAVALLAITANAVASCSGSSGSTGGSAADAGSDATASCGAMGASCCNTTACNAGLECVSGTCAGSPTLDATTDAANETNDGGVVEGMSPATDASSDAAEAASEALYDPQPVACDGGGTPPAVGGTADCPGDKNLPGCPCATVDASAACWTGYRHNRAHGACHDGTSTCTSSGGSSTWGACDGEQLPTATTGKAACGCFSTGLWAVDNVSPCLFTDGSVTGAISTTLLAGSIVCPATFSAAPAAAWSTDTLTVDCAGQWTLCFTLKAGDGAHPSDTDCVITQVCTQSHYSAEGTAVAFPPLPGWLAPPSADACVSQFVASGGYGQMSVEGQSDECEAVARVFQTVNYCPQACNDPNPPAMCAQCLPGGGGAF